MRSFLRSKLALGLAIVVVVGGAATFIATRGGDGGPVLSVGSLAVRPDRLIFDVPAHGGDQFSKEIELRNTATTPTSYVLSADVDWLIFGADVSGVIAPSALRTVRVFVDTTATPSSPNGTVTVSSGGASAAIAVTLIPGTAGNAATGLRAIPDSLEFNQTATTGEVELTNRSSGSTSWRAVVAASWMTVSPVSGTLDARGRIRLEITIDRGQLTFGNHTSSFTVTSDQGDISINVSVVVAAVPILDLPQTTVDFGRARQGRKTLSFIVRNAGHEPLTYQVSNDRFYVFLDDTASGTVQPGKTANVNVTFDHNTSLYGVRDFPLGVSSNGGSGSVRVLGITDTVGPKATHENMTFIHTHSDGQRYRHARADLNDEFGKVVSARVQYRTCTGTPPAPPACSPWAVSEMRRYRGATWEGDVGPVPACTGATGVFINYRIQAEDDLINHRYNPGSSTFYDWIHCKPPG